MRLVALPALSGRDIGLGFDRLQLRVGRAGKGDAAHHQGRRQCFSGLPAHQMPPVASCRGISPSRGKASRAVVRGSRSEEHTSELQSLMRNSYAGFCWKKKKLIDEHTDKQ